MADKSVSAAGASRQLSASRQVNQRAAESTQSQAKNIARQEAKLESRDRVIAENQLGKNVNVRV